MLNLIFALALARADYQAFDAAKLQALTGIAYDAVPLEVDVLQQVRAYEERSEVERVRRLFDLGAAAGYVITGDWRAQLQTRYKQLTLKKLVVDDPVKDAAGATIPFAITIAWATTWQRGEATVHGRITGANDALDFRSTTFERPTAQVNQAFAQAFRIDSWSGNAALAPSGPTRDELFLRALGPAALAQVYIYVAHTHYEWLKTKY